MSSGGDRRSVLELLVTRYADLRHRLIRSLGSADAASEALSDAYIRLETGEEPAGVGDPDSYLFRSLLNAAHDRRRREARRLSEVELDELWELADPRLNPEAIAELRADVARLEDALAELPERARAIVAEARVQGLTHETIAARHGVSTRTVQLDLRRALEHCASRLGRRLTRRFGLEDDETS